jgi:hypothetical protein
MDYGYQLLRHAVQQVCGHIRPAARLTLALFLTPVILFLLLTGGTGFASVASAEAVGGGLVLALLVTVVVAVLAYCWAAVGWHRYVLLEEIGPGVFPQWRPGEVMAYLGRAIIVILVVIAGGIAAGIAVGLVVGITQSEGIAILMGIGLVFGLTWLATRIGLVLPAAALGTRMTIGESWRATAPVSGQILLPLIVIAAVFGLIGQVVLMIFGQTVPVESFGVVQDQVVLSLPGNLVNAELSWLQILIHLALMTTLYGNLIEGRQLN